MATISLFYKIDPSETTWRLVDVPAKTSRRQAVEILLKNTGFKHGTVSFYTADDRGDQGYVLCQHFLKSAQDNLPLPLADIDPNARMPYRAIIEPGTHSC